MDQARLDFLLSSWEVRRILPPPVLSDMRRVIGRRIVTERPAPRQRPPPFRPPHMADMERGRGLGGRHSADRDDPYSRPPQQFRSGGAMETGPGHNTSRKRPFQADEHSQYESPHRPQPTPFNLPHQPEVTPPPSEQRSIRALIGEEAVSIDLQHAKQIAQRLSGGAGFPLPIQQASQLVSARLNSLLSYVSGEKDTIPHLPPFLSGKRLQLNLRIFMRQQPYLNLQNHSHLILLR